VRLAHGSKLRRIISVSAYPFAMAGAVAGYLLLSHIGLHLEVATFLPVLLAAIVITLLERLLPVRKDWLPDLHDVANDAGFMLMVQVLLPSFLAFLVAITLLNTLAAAELQATGLWPGRWPIAIQLILLLVVVEFPRYWLHRLAHNWTPLWQLHAVHHSPQKLYWLNVGRFHPFEKALQYIFDTLPFILLGVSEHLLALYFVFYACNGFFQHSNVDVRLGWLNWVISGPELHRWHHSKEIGESNNNYGNNLILWDLVFGSRFLPVNRQVEELGLINRTYPSGFWQQMKTPFMRGLDKQSW
jgi:ornithine lipid hydroxylase